MLYFRILIIAATVGAAVGCTPRSTVGPSPRATPSPPVTTTASAFASPAAPTTATPAPSGVPQGFSPISVTFVSLQTGWVLGSTCATCMLSILRTRDGGSTWAALPVPPLDNAGPQVLGPDRIRFANASDGWVVASDLWETHDGGSHWAKVGLPVAVPAQVADLAASGGVVHAVVFDATNVFNIVSSPSGSDEWQVSPTKLPVGAGPVPTAQLILQGSAGWVLQNDRTVVNGARLSGADWVPWPPPPAVGGTALLAASTPQYLVAASNEGVWTGPPIGAHVFVATDGIHAQRVTSTVPASSVDAVGTPAAGLIVLAGQTATTRELLRSSDGGLSWTAVFSGGLGSWQDLGFTSPTQGVVIERGSDTQPGRLLMTHDGGQTWAPVSFTQAPPPR